MIYLILIIIIILLLIYIYKKDKKIKLISKQVNDILFEQNHFYIQQYQEGALSILESEIIKLVNRLSEQNILLSKDKVLLKSSLEDISHQMKTPLTSLNLIHERLKSAEGIDKKKLLKEQEKVIYKIEWLVSSLLKMAQIDANTIIFKEEKISQRDFIKKIIDNFEIQLELKDIQLETNIEEKDLCIDILWTIEAISNILKNCIDYIQEEGYVKITIKSNPIYDEIIIEDNGPGICKEDIPHLFDRFYKGKNSNSQSVGIGLALSHMIIENQNGTISVENNFPGTKFMIHFYKEVI